MEHWCFRLLMPPETYRLPPFTQAAWSARGRGMGSTSTHLSLMGSYFSQLSDTFPPWTSPPETNLQNDSPWIYFFSFWTTVLIQQSWRGVPFEHLFGGEIYFSRVKILCAEWKLSALKFMMRIWFDKHKIEIFPQNFTFLCTCLFYRVNNAIFTDKNHVCEWKVA